MNLINFDDGLKMDFGDIVIVDNVNFMAMGKLALQFNVVW